MIYFEKYTGEKTYILGNGELGTKERVLRDFPAALDFVHIVGTDESGETMFSMDSLSKMRSIYNIDSSLSETEAIQAIQDIMNAPAQEPEPDAQTVALEDIAAQLEYQNMMSLEDVESEV